MRCKLVIKREQPAASCSYQTLMLTDNVYPAWFNCGSMVTLVHAMSECRTALPMKIEMGGDCGALEYGACMDKAGVNTRDGDR